MYSPDSHILRKYANVLVNFGLNGGKGVKPGEIVRLEVFEASKPMLQHLIAAVLEAGAHPVIDFRPDGVQKLYLETGSDEQVSFFPEILMKGWADQIDHRIHMRAIHDPFELSGVDPAKILLDQKKYQPLKTWYSKKERAGKLSWTLASFPTPAVAAVAGMTLKDYWEQVILACYLNEDDPIAKWKEIVAEIDRVKAALNKLDIDTLHVEAEDADLHLVLGENRQWVGGGGRNIPSFEIFTSPDRTGTNGHIGFNQPLFRYGSKISGIRLVFKDGLITEATAIENEALLQKMIFDTKNADAVGEFSLTAGSMSQITKFMGDTLFDENVGGPEGNTHIAFGSSYPDAYTGDLKEVSKEELDKLNFNDINCPEHCDVMSTSRRKVTATLKGGGEKVIYENGEFTV